MCISLAQASSLASSTSNTRCHSVKLSPGSSSTCKSAAACLMAAQAITSGWKQTKATVLNLFSSINLESPKSVDKRHLSYASLV